MVGRAGRAGFGDNGESILICSNQDNIRVMELLCSPMEKVNSQMHQDEARALRALFLSAIGLGIATCQKELQKLTATTLMAVQTERLEMNRNQITNNVIKKMIIDKTIKLKVQVPKDEIKRNNKPDITPKILILTPSRQLDVTKMGIASFESGIDLDESKIILSDLLKAQKSLVLSDHLHLLYLVTPCDAIDIIKPDKRLFYAKVSLKSLNQQTTQMLNYNYDFTSTLI